MRKPKTSRFGMGLLIYSAALAVAVAVLLCVLSAFLASFERNRPDRIARDFVSTLDEEYVKALMGEWDSGEFETVDTLYEASDLSCGKELDYRKKADEYTSRSPVYHISLEGKSVGRFLLLPDGKDSFGITRWRAEGAELYESEVLPDPKSYTVKVPCGASVAVNGVVASDKYRTEVGVKYTGSVYFGEPYIEEQRCDTYTLPPLISEPRIEVETEGRTVTPALLDREFDAFAGEGLSLQISAPSDAAVMIDGTRIPDGFFTKTDEPVPLTEFEAKTDIKRPTLMYARILLRAAEGELAVTVDGKALDVTTSDRGMAAVYRHDSLKSLEIIVPEGAQIKINGVKVGENYYEGEGVFSMLYGLEEHAGRIGGSRVYCVNGLFADPQVEVSLGGDVLPLCRSDLVSGVTRLEYCGLPSETLKAETKARVEDFSNAYITYTCSGYAGVEENHARLMTFLLPGTDTYKKLKKSKESFSWAENYTVTDRRTEAGDFIPLSEDSFFCTVEYTANLKKYSYEIEQRGIFRILMIRNGDAWSVGGLLTETK